jgi:hypothetical protein
MATFSKIKLSESTDGLPIKVVQTATAGTTIHTAHASALDEVWLYAYNGNSADVVLTIEYGGATVPDQNIITTVVSKAGLVLVVPGLLLTNSKVLKAFAATANVITLSGYINRIA